MCPFSQKLLAGEGSYLARGRLVCHCLLIETSEGLVLVDTGFGLEDMREPARRLGPVRHVLAPTYDEGETAVRQIEALGLSPDDVRHIVLTHLDLDHAGGISDFPRARVHLMADEQKAALSPSTAEEKRRYRTSQWSHGPQWATYDVNGEGWKGFDCVRGLEGLPPEILLVPLPGHTRGHAAVAVDSDEGWLLHCGDAYFFRGEVDPVNPHCTPGLKLFQRLAAIDDRRRLANQGRLQELARDHGHEVRLFCAHDPVELSDWTS
jgi:glyoxylase-like metal-dependent hydrolase (beta-lactamase superfamily II)